MELIPRKLYKDMITGTIVGVSYGSADTELVNEVLLSTDKAVELKLQDSDILQYLDLPVVDVFKGKMNMLFPASSQTGFNKDDEEDGILLSVTEQIIHGHVFQRTSGVEMNNSDALKRVLSAYEGKGEKDNERYK